jgi:hypothetical protein
MSSNLIPHSILVFLGIWTADVASRVNVVLRYSPPSLTGGPTSSVPPVETKDEREEGENDLLILPTSAAARGGITGTHTCLHCKGKFNVR